MTDQERQAINGIANVIAFLLGYMGEQELTPSQREMWQMARERLAESMYVILRD